MSCIKDNCT